MIALSLHPIRSQIPITTISCSYKPPKTSLRATTTTVPARDRIIDFGKFKGQMLGTLPSTYLRWVSKNLRARDFEEWAKLADEVLTDPVYKDRVEWEFADKLLNGDVLASPLLLQQGDHSAVSQLLEISERFGWDNEDKAAWSKIDFKFLGTSRGGRIPRVDDNRRAVKTGSSPPLDKTRSPALQSSKRSKKYCDGEVEERRKERRERSRRLSLRGSSNGPAIEDNEKGSFGITEKVELKSDQDISKDRVVEVQQSRFPGREGLLKRALSRKRQ